MNKIILTGAIGSGKTTLLEKFTQQYSSAGILTPIRDGLRVLIDIVTQEQFIFENPWAIHPVSIGKYIFEQEALDRANSILKSVHQEEWKILDEIGKLELQGQGLDIRNILPITSSHIVVIRDTLLEEVKNEFALHDYEIMNANQFSLKFDL
jgi:nucleoside-triphosphatase THEP1